MRRAVTLIGTLLVALFAVTATASANLMPSAFPCDVVATLDDSAGAAHHHDAGADELGGEAATCCGVPCSLALAGSVPFAAATATVAIAPAPLQVLDGRPPPRIERPPRVALG